MFNWVVKVVPQPAAGPEEAAKTSAVHQAPKNKEVKSAVLKTSEEVSEEGQVQAGVMGWLSNGFSSALPQPPGTGRLSRANSDARQPGDDAERSGVISWVTQGLTKVLPQPDAKYKEEETKNPEEHTEVYEVATMPDYDPLPHIPVVEMISEDEASEVESLTPQFPPKVVNWIKQIIPQPVILPPGAVPSEPPAKVSRSSLDKILSPPPESLSGISLDTDNKPSGVVDWFVSGLGLKMPQLVLPSKDEAEASAEVLKKASSKLNPDMVLEDLESDNEVQQKHEDQIKAASMSPSTTTQPPQREEAPQKQLNSSMTSQKSEAPTDNVEKGSQEDAETQTGRWTPFIENIKKEAEDVALATMEERLLQERIEMTRLAEEVARHTAEMAVRQMASEGTSIKLSLESQELLEEPEAELPEPQEEEEEEEEQQKEVTGDEEGPPTDEKKVETEDSVIKEPEPEKASEPELELLPEPSTPTQEAATEGQPVTQQPQRAEDAQVPNTEEAHEKDAEAAGDDCGAPVSCDALKSCLMRFPLTSECFGNINAFFKENGIPPPKIPSMPKLPTQLSEVTKYLPTLPPELRQEFSQIRLTQVPRSIAQTLTELLPKNQEGSGGPSLSDLSQRLSDLPQKLSQFPSRTQQYFVNVKNRLNSLLPQDA
ncbi:cyclic nucleotide-gated cation channel beta-1-like isoform X1 [Oryzias latipes]|uniref:cyclic nucleotide-gated cation channel beta-1-like isoform X1 n=1 Tax=Oryzias latipes TaxID=8090 RepID=UPI000CE25656|nr:cyclic nucleotide-gated cation channel beta-1-like isoform X1 [Oryzias latipes]